MALKTPLLLTEYLENGRLKEGREAARVEPFVGDVQSYSGLLTVDSINGAHLFFWFFPSEAGPQAPLILSTNGMGTPSTYAVFKMAGPYKYDGQSIGLRERSWTKQYNMLYIDAPVGVGFSFFENQAGCPGSDEESAQHLKIALSQFFHFFPELKTNDFYISGVSYSGKHSLHLAKLLKNSNLKGILLGSPLIEGNRQIRVADYLYMLGLLQEKDRDEVNIAEERIEQFVKEERWEDAFHVLLSYHLGEHFDNYFGPISLFSPLREMENVSDKLLNLEETQQKLHMTGNPPGPWQRAYQFYKHLYLPVTTVLEDVLSDTRVLMYWGQLDGAMPIYKVEEFLFTLNWKGAEGFKNATRENVFDCNKLVGFSRSYGNLTSVTVRDAGHIIAEDKPQVVLEIISQFIGSPGNMNAPLNSDST